MTPRPTSTNTNVLQGTRTGAIWRRLRRQVQLLFVAMLLGALGLPTLATERWLSVPPTPEAVKGAQTGYAEVNGIKLYYATIGRGSPVILLHGGLSNSNYWGHQVQALKAHHKVILVDSRGHGRSSRDAQPFGYDLMADDVVALMDKLKVPKADIVGWSDGGILALDLAMRHPTRVGKIVAFAANTKVSGVNSDVEKNPTFASFIERASKEYLKLSGRTSQDYEAFVSQISKMWFSQPDWSDAQLKSIRSPVLVMVGDHDEGIKREHTEYIAATIPGAGLMILPNVSHFAFLQDPVSFNHAILHFLGDI